MSFLGTVSPSAPYIHPNALCESAAVGARTRVWAFAHVMDGAVIGEDCNIGDHCYIDTGARVGDRVTIKNGVALWERVLVEDDVFIGPNAVLTNDPRPRTAIRRTGEELLPTVLRRGATVGANATIVCGVVVGRNAFIGAGAVVTRDVPAHALVLGNPARQRGWVCACSERLPDDLVCVCGAAHALLSKRAGLAVTFRPVPSEPHRGPPGRGRQCPACRKSG